VDDRCEHPVTKSATDIVKTTEDDPDIYEESLLAHTRIHEVLRK
jgi:hypothetical protein